VLFRARARGARASKKVTSMVAFACLCQPTSALPFTVVHDCLYLNRVIPSRQRKMNYLMNSMTMQIRGLDCHVNTWEPKEKQQQAPRAAVVIYHGFLAHGKYPTVRYAAELLAENGYTVIAADLPGHGRSPGTRGYLSSASVLIEDGVAIAKHAKESNPGISLVLIGSSMGGTIALSVAKEIGDMVSGVVLLAPMLKISVSDPARYLLRGLSFIVPTLALIPSSATSAEKQYRDPIKRKECEDDELSISGSHLRVASASTCVELATQIQTEFPGIECPFLCMIAEEDVVVNNEGSMALMEQAKCQDKTLKRYKALHGLLCEPSPLVDQIQNDMLSWLNART
jgi:acylglycerol lipase